MGEFHPLKIILLYFIFEVKIHASNFHIISDIFISFWHDNKLVVVALFAIINKRKKSNNMFVSPPFSLQIETKIERRK